MENFECLECHNDQSLQAVTEPGANLKLHVSEEGFSASRHEALDCIECHPAAEPEGYATVPHLLQSTGKQDCQTCHGQFFEEINHGYQGEIHTRLSPESFQCNSCHDPHTVGYLTDRISDPLPADRIAHSNGICLTCHATEWKTTTGMVKTFAKVHTTLPSADRHLTMARCVDCHTDPEDPTNHQVVPVLETVSCNTCHTSASLLLTKLYQPATQSTTDFSFLNRGLLDDAGLIERIKAAGGTIPERRPVLHDDVAWHYINQPLLANFYLIGATRHKLADRLLVSVLLVTAGLILAHMVLRTVFSFKRKRTKVDFTETFVNTLQIRIWHWLNALLMVLLLLSGYSLHYAAKGTLWIDFATAVELHEVAGLGLTGCYLFFLIAGLWDGNLKNYLPHRQNAWMGWLRQLRFYLWGILTGEAHPFHPQQHNKFNPLQKLIYTPLMFLVFPVLVLSGVWLMFPDTIPPELLGQSGKPMVALTHLIAAGLFGVFMLVHVYLAFTGDKLSFLIRSMITGYYRSLKSGR